MTLSIGCDWEGCAKQNLHSMEHFRLATTLVEDDHTQTLSLWFCVPHYRELIKDVSLMTGVAHKAAERMRASQRMVTPWPDDPFLRPPADPDRPVVGADHGPGWRELAQHDPTNPSLRWMTARIVLAGGRLWRRVSDEWVGVGHGGPHLVIGALSEVTSGSILSVVDAFDQLNPSIPNFECVDGDIMTLIRPHIFMPRPSTQGTMSP